MIVLLLENHIYIVRVKLRHSLRFVFHLFKIVLISSTDPNGDSIIGLVFAESNQVARATLLIRYHLSLSNQICL